MSKVIEKINEWFGERADTILKFRWLIIAALLVVCILFATGLPRLQIENSAESWLLQDDPLKKADDEFKEIFGNNDYVVVLVETDNVFTQKVLRMMRELGEELELEVPLAKKITSLTHLEFTRGTVDGIDIDELVPEEIPSDPAALAEIKRLAMSKEYLVDRLFSQDGTKALILLELTNYPEVNPDTGKKMVDLDSQALIDDKVNEILGREEYQGYTFFTAGIPVMMAEEFKFMNADMERILEITILVMIILLAIVFRSAVGIVAPMLTAILSVICVLGAMGWMGINLQETVMIVPLLLILVVSVGYCVHLLSFFRQQMLTTGKRRESIKYALQHAAWPILFTAITTTIGFLSFMAVPVMPVQQAGGMSAALVMVSYPILIMLTPILLSIGKDREPNKEYVQNWGGRPERILVSLGDWVRGHSVMIVIIFILVTAVFAFNVPAVDVNTDYVKTIGLDVPYVSSAFHIASSIGSLYSYDATFDFGSENAAKDPDVLKRLDTLADEMLEFDDNKRTTSINDIVKDLNQTLNEDNPEYYRIPDNEELLAQLLLLYEMSGGTDAEDWIDYEYRIPRLQVELQNYSSKGADRQISYLQTRAAELFPDARFGISGIAVTFAKMINYLVNGQIWSVLIALACISLVMMAVFGSVKLGLIGMIPNISPVIFVLGAMALFGSSINMMTVIIAPMIIGLAVDDTIHYINHFKQAFWRTGSYAQANRETFHTVGKAIFLTSFIICLGFLAFTTSQINAFKEIGLYTVLAVTTALLSDYLVTPVIIMWTKPFGKEGDTAEAIAK